MVRGCFSLSHVSDDEYQAKAGVKPKPKRRDDPNKGLKKSRIKDRFKNAFSRRNDDDPLSIVGCELSLREHPLAVLEIRNGRKSNVAAGQPQRQKRSPRCRHSPRLKDKIHDDQEKSLHKVSPRHKCSPGHNDKTKYDDDEGERLLRLQNIVYKNLKCSFSEETIASVRSRGLDEIGDMLTPSSPLSNLIQQSIHNTYSHHAQHVRRMVLKKIHGNSTRSNPMCPYCFGSLTYRYISKKNQHISVCDILAGRDHTREKLQNLLPPLCEKCETHLIYEHSDSKLLLMENFGVWLENGFGEESDLEEQRQEHESGCCNFNDPLNAKIMVVPEGEPSNQSAAQISPLTFGDQRMDYPTPRRSNSSCSERRESSPQFRFDGTTDAALDNPVFSGLSDLSTKTYRRKAEIEYMDTENADRVKLENKASDENHREDVATPADDETSMATDSAANESNGISEDSQDSYSSDEDPFSEMHSIDEMTVFEPDNSGGNGSCRGSEISDTVQKFNEKPARVAEIPPVNSSLVQSLSDKTSESIDVVNTESEEHVILERYSMKKEVATKQIAKDLIRGRELTILECDRCGMPMMKKGDDLECVVCPAIQRQAKRMAKQKRKAVGLTKCDEQRDLTLGGVEGNGGDKKEEDSDESSRSFTYDLIYAALEQNDDTGTTQSFSDAKLNKDSISLAILEETKLISALEEGQLGYGCPDENGPFLFLGDCSEGINYGSKHSADNPPPILYPQSSSSSLSLNPNVTKQTARYSFACSQSIDSSWYSATRQPSTALSSYSSRSSSASHPAVEHSLSSYEVITRQHGLDPPFRSVSNQYLDSISEVSEPRAGPGVESVTSHYEGSSSEVSRQHVASPHCTSSETMFQNNQSSRIRSQFQGSSSEVSACEYPRLPRFSETSQLQCDRSTATEDQSSRGAEARGYRSFPPHETVIYDHQQSATLERGIQPHHSINSQRKSSQSEDSVDSVLPEENQYTSSELTHHQCQPTLASEKHICHSQSDQSETQCPRNLPRGEMIHSQRPLNETAEINLRGLNIEHPVSISDVSVNQSSPMESIQCPSHNHSHRNQLKLTSSEESHTRRCRHNLPSGSSVSEVTMIHSDMSSTKCPRDLAPSDMIYPASAAFGLRSNAADASEKPHLSEDSTEKSLTHCPRDLPSNEMIWNYESGGSPSTQVRPALDQRWVAQEANNDERRQTGLYSQQSLPKQIGLGVESLQKEMCNEAYESVTIPTSEKNVLKEDGDAIPSEGIQARVADNRHDDSQDICHQNSASLANMQGPGEITVPVKGAKDVKTDEHLKSDPPREDEESLSDKIARLENSLRDAGQLPTKDDCKHKDIDTGSQCKNSTPLERTRHLVEEKLQPTPDDPFEFISPSVSNTKKIYNTKYEANQIDGSQSRGRGRPVAGFGDMDQNRGPSKDDNKLNWAKLMADQKTSESHLRVSCLYPPPQSDNLISISVRDNDQIKKNGETTVVSETLSLERAERLDGGKQQRTPLDPRNLISPSILNTTYEIHQLDGSPSEHRGGARGSFGERDQNRVWVSSKEKKDKLAKPSGSHRIVPCLYPPPHSDNPILALDNDHIEKNYETIEASEKFTLDDKPLLPPVVKDYPPHYPKDKHSPRRRTKRQEGLHNVTVLDSSQRSMSFWQHKGYAPLPMDSLYSSSSFRRRSHTHQRSNGTLPRCRPGQNEQRLDPPGQRMDSSGGKTEDPPGTPSGFHSTRINFTPKSKRKIPSPNVTIPGGDSQARDPSPRNAQDDAHPNHPIQNSITWKPTDNYNKAGTLKNPDARDPSPKNTEEDEPHPKSCTDENIDGCNESGQHRLQALREKREWPQHISNEEACHFQEEEHHLQDESAKNKRIFHEEEARKQHHLQTLSGERQRQQLIVQEDIRRMKKDRQHLQEGMEGYLLRGAEHKQQNLQILREEQEQQQRIVKEAAHQSQEEQRRLHKEKDETKRILQEGDALRKERKRQQRIVQDDSRHILQKEQRCLLEEREEKLSTLQEEGGRENQCLKNLQEQRQQHQHVTQAKLHSHQEKRQCLQGWEQRQRTLTCEYSVTGGSVRTARGEIKSHKATLPSSGLHSEVNEYNNEENEDVAAAGCEVEELPQNELLQEETGNLNSPSWVHEPLKRANSWGESSLNDLFRQIDEIEDDFNTMVATLPSSEGQSIASSIKDSTLKENKTPKRKSGDEHPLFEITLNNAGSFDSNASRDSTVVDVMQRMRRIKDCIERIDSVDDGADRSVSSQSYDSQGEMSQLILRLTNAAAELRTFHEWED